MFEIHFLEYKATVMNTVDDDNRGWKRSHEGGMQRTYADTQGMNSMTILQIENTVEDHECEP